MTIYEYLFIFIVLHVACCINNIHFIKDYEVRRYEEISKTGNISKELMDKRLESLAESLLMTKAISVIPLLSTLVSLIVLYLILRD